MRIVSLIPEATEILRALGLASEIGAWPGAVEGAGDDGEGALTEVLRAARPALVFTSETAGGGGVPRPVVRRLVASLRPRPAVYALEPRSLGAILADVKTVGDATGRQAEARPLLDGLRARIDAVTLRAARALASGPPRRVACLSRAQPPIAAGWWLAELIGLAGGLDVLDGAGRPPRAVTWDRLRAAGPELVLWVDRGSPPGALSSPTASTLGRTRPSPRSSAPSAGSDAPSWEQGVSAGELAADWRVLGPVHPGPSVVGLLERLLALIVPGRPGATDRA